MQKFVSMAEKGPNVQSERGKKYYKENKEALMRKNKQRYRDKADAARKVPQGVAAPMPKMPPLPREVEKMNKQRRKAKAKVVKSIPKRKRKESKARNLPEAKRPRKGR